MQSSRQSKPAAWSAMPIQSGAQPSAPASAARASSGVLFCCDRCAAMMCCRRDVSSAASSRRRRLVVQMAEAARDALLERVRIVAALEQVEVVVAFEHQRVAAGQARLDVRRRDAEVGQHAEAARAVADHELHRLARVVRHRERADLERRRSRTRRGCRSRRRCAMPSKRSDTAASVPNVTQTGMPWRAANAGTPPT